MVVRSYPGIAGAERLYRGSSVVLWEEDRVPPRVSERIPICAGECDPWHMLSRAVAVVAEPGDVIFVIAELLSVPCYIVDPATGETSAA